MIRSYDVDIARALGKVEDAVLLKEIAFWCARNEEKGVNIHGGRAWTYNTLEEWQKRFPEFKVRPVFRRLRDGGWLIAAEYNDDPWNHKKWYALSDKAISLFEHIDLSETENRMDETGQCKKTDKPISKQTIEEILKKSAEVIDRLYALYPGKSETREGPRSTGKCSKDKRRIAALLRDHTPEQLERIIKKYVEEQRGKYLKNFSTFLNNLPEDEEEAAPPPTREERARALGYQTWNE